MFRMALPTPSLDALTTGARARAAGRARADRRDRRRPRALSPRHRHRQRRRRAGRWRLPLGAADPQGAHRRRHADLRPRGRDLDRRRPGRRGDAGAGAGALRDHGRLRGGAARGLRVVRSLRPGGGRAAWRPPASTPAIWRRGPRCRTPTSTCRAPGGSGWCARTSWAPTASGWRAIPPRSPPPTPGSRPRASPTLGRRARRGGAHRRRRAEGGGRDHRRTTSRWRSASTARSTTQKGCYLGQEPIVRIRDRGHINWRLVGLEIDGPRDPAAQDAIESDVKPKAGRVTSAARLPGGRGVALALLHVSVPDGQRRAGQARRRPDPARVRSPDRAPGAGPDPSLDRSAPRAGASTAACASLTVARELVFATHGKT